MSTYYDWSQPAVFDGFVHGMALVSEMCIEQTKLKTSIFLRVLGQKQVDKCEIIQVWKSS